MPLVQLVVAARKIHVRNVLVVHGTGAHLVVARRQKLNEAVPKVFVLRLHKFHAQLFQHANGLHQALLCRGHHTVTAEVRFFKRLRLNFVHRARGVRHGAHLIRVEFLPPVDRRGEVDRNEDLSDEFAVIRTRLAQTFCKAQVVFAENERAVRLGVAVHAAPAVHGVACASDGVFKVHDACTFDLNHVVQPFVFKLFVVLRARVDGKRAVQLLAQHNTCQLVRKRHRRHGNALRALLHAVVQPV